MKPFNLIVAILCLSLLAGIAYPDDFYWVNSSGGDYGVDTNWSPTGVPGSADNAFFLDVDDIYTITFDNNYSIYQSQFDAGKVTLDLNGYQYDILRTLVGDDAAVIGYNADAEVTVINSGNVFSGNVIIGREATSHGILNIDGFDTLWQVKREEGWYSLFIGGNGRGDLHISNGGIMDHGAGLAATHYPSRAFITVDGLDSVWRVDGYLAMGYRGIAIVEVRNQGAVNIGLCEMALNPGSQAFMTVTGLDSENHSEFYLRSFFETSLTIGYRGSARLTCLNNGKIINEGLLAIAAEPGSYGELNLSQSWADVRRSMSIGGTLAAAGGTAVVNILRDGRLSIGEYDPGDSLVVWPGGTVNLCQGELDLYIQDEPRTMPLHGRLTGTGTVNAIVNNFDGIVAPGSGFNLPLELEILADYTQGSTGRLKITIAEIPGTSDSWHGRLYVSNGGVANLDGYLDVTLSNFVPDAEDSFIIVDAPDGVTGRFINTPDDVYIGSSGTFDVQYNSDSVVLTNYRLQACVSVPTADLNGDCDVNLLDFTILAENWLNDGLSP